MTTKTLIEQLHQLHKDSKQVESCLGACLQIQEANTELIEIIKKKLEKANDKARQL
jgi:hypothetical protein